MKLKIGDLVRFLNSVGGGKVTRVEGKMVYVEDEDGFEIPSLESEVVLIERPEQVTAPPKIAPDPVVSLEIPEDESYAYAHEEADEANPRVFAAFLRDGNGNTPFVNLHLVNDSNYFAYFTMSEVTQAPQAKVLHFGTIEPNTKLLLGRYNPQGIDQKEWQVQLLFFKKSSAYGVYPPVSTGFKVKSARFFKEGGFAANDYFHEKAVMIALIKNEMEKKLEQLGESELFARVAEKEQVSHPVKAKRRDDSVLLEVDLHIHELLDDVRGLSAGEMLQIQLDKVKLTLEQNMTHKGRKVVFIHGIGNGTLKTELRKMLNQKYHKLYYQDASFQEYGYGATMVIL